MIIQKPYVITIVGAESSGKTLLATTLAKSLNAGYVPEYAREYLANLTEPYTEKNLQDIAKKDLQRISKALSSTQDFMEFATEENFHHLIETQRFQKLLLFVNTSIVEHNIKLSHVNSSSAIVIVDGGMLTMRMWARIKFEITLPEVEKALADDVTDLYLLCRPRREWSPDPLRESPSLVERSWIYNQYLRELIAMEEKFEIVEMRE